jgi:hypothetical protein
MIYIHNLFEVDEKNKQIELISILHSDEVSALANMLVD